MEYLPKLFEIIPEVNSNIRFKELYDEWLPLHEVKVSKSTIDCYKSAVKYYETIYFAKFADIKTEHLQKCVTECQKGRRNKENMKALGTLLYKYAIQKDLVEKDYAQFIYLGHSEQTERESFSLQEIEAISQAVGTIPYADYILVLIYTGFRINEFLSLKTEHYHMEEQYLIGGSKTKAGKNRIVTLSPKIQRIVSEIASQKSEGDFLFSDKGGNKISDSVFREKFYYPALAAIGVSKLPPHSCRHTFATLMKNVDAPNVDKQKLIGHSSFEMTAHYTHTNYQDLKKITDKL